MRSIFFSKHVHCFFSVLFSAVTVICGQNLGTVDLPASLADPRVQIVNMVPVKPQRIGYCEGPVVDKFGTLYFSEQNAGIIWKVTSNGQISKFLTLNPAYVNGLDIAPSGNLVVCEKNRITERDFDGNLIRVITSGTDWGQGANDLSFASNNDLFYTAFNQHFWFHSAYNHVDRDYNFNYPSNIYFNGIEFLEEKNILYACQWGQNRVMKYSVGEDREVDVHNGQSFVSVPGPDGITLDENYNVYIASNNNSTGGIYVYDPAGNQLGSILMRQDNNPGSNASNCVFGGPENKTLYITGDSGAYKVELRVAGRVRPDGNTFVKGKEGSRFYNSVIQKNPRLIATKNGKDLKISITGFRNDAVGTIFSLSGRELRRFFINSASPFYWQPPSGAAFIVRISACGLSYSKMIGNI